MHSWAWTWYDESYLRIRGHQLISLFYTDWHHKYTVTEMITSKTRLHVSLLSLIARYRCSRASPISLLAILFIPDIAWESCDTWPLVAVDAGFCFLSLTLLSDLANVISLSSIAISGLRLDSILLYRSGNMISWLAKSCLILCLSCEKRELKL